MTSIRQLRVARKLAYLRGERWERLGTYKRDRYSSEAWQILTALEGDATELRDLVEAVRPVLAAYRSSEAHITERQIVKAWAAYDAARAALNEVRPKGADHG